MFSHIFCKRNLIRVFSVLVVTSILFFVFFKTKTYPEKIVIDSRVFSVEVADNVVLMSKGLSGHSALSDQQGMLFVFSSPGKHDFWMKDMTFPIDIIWFDQNRLVIYIEKAVSPKTFPKTFGPTTNSVYVLEVNSGLSDKFGIKIGDQFDFVKSTGRNLGL